MNPSVDQTSLGVAPDVAYQGDREVVLFRLQVDGLAIEVVTLGASLFAVETADREGTMGNVVLGLPDLDACIDPFRNHWLGSTVGRFANRIGGARVEIDGVQFELTANEAPNILHGGASGFGRLVWDGEATTGEDWAELRLTLVSPDGHEGFPGQLTATTTYRIEPGKLIMTHEATTDAPTVVALTNHAYWNLAGHGSIRGQQLQVAAKTRLITDDESIPTGELRDVAGTPYDLRSPRSLAAIIGELRGLDDCFVLDGGSTSPAAVVSDRQSGRWMEVFTDQPSVQVYTGNNLSGAFQPFAAICLETQQFPDAPNKPSFPSTVLRPGERFSSRTEHRFGVSDN